MARTASGRSGSIAAGGQHLAPRLRIAPGGYEQGLADAERHHSRPAQGVQLELAGHPAAGDHGGVEMAVQPVEIGPPPTEGAIDGRRRWGAVEQGVRIDGDGSWWRTRT